MKIACVREKFLEAISGIQGAVNPKTTLPILSNVLVEADGQMLTFTSTDLDIGIKYTIPVEVAEPGATTLPARRLFGIIRELPPGNVSLSVDSMHAAIISCSNAHFKILGMARDEFPKLPEFSEGHALELPQAVLKDMINKTAYAAAHEEARYVLGGVYLVVKANKGIMVATDGRRLAFVEKRIELPKGAEIETIIPTKTLGELVKHLGDNGVVTILLAKNQIAFKTANSLLISRLVEGKYPNYKQVIPDGLEQKIILNKEEFLSAVRRSSLIADHLSNSVKLKFLPNQLVISTNTPDVGESHESLDIPYNGKETDVSFNPALILDALRVIDTEEILLEVTDSANPGIIRTGSEFLYVIMPMKLV